MATFYGHPALCGNLPCLANKYAATCTTTITLQNESFRADVDMLRLKLQSSVEEIETLKMSLEKSQAGGNELHHDSDAVMQNVSRWIPEQKYS